MWRNAMAIGALILVGTLALACNSTASGDTPQTPVARDAVATPAAGDAGSGSAGSTPAEKPLEGQGSSGSAGSLPADRAPDYVPPLPVVIDPATGKTNPAVTNPASPPIGFDGGAAIDLPAARPPVAPNDGPMSSDPATSYLVPSEPSPIQASPGKPLVDPNQSVSSRPLPQPGVDVPASAPAMEPSQPALLPLPAGTKRVAAPIDGAQIVVRESFPPQYSVEVQAGLPGGCARPAGYEVERTGTTYYVRVFNAEPAQPSICTAIYGMYRLGVSLSDVQAGLPYTVNVNGKVVTFTAQ